MRRNVDDEFQVVFNVVFLKLMAMTEDQVQHAQIGIQSVNLSITSTRHYPIEPIAQLCEASFTW